MARPIDRKDLDHLSGYTGKDSGHLPHPSWIVLADPAFLRPLQQFLDDNPPVSSRSTFREEDWWLDLPPKAGSYLTISFRNVAPKLAYELKVALLVAIAHPALGGLTIPLAAKLGRNLSRLGSWMTHIGLRSISQLPEGVGYIYLEALAEYADLVATGTFDPEGGDWCPQSQALNHKKVRQLSKSKDLAMGAGDALLRLYNAGHVLEPLIGVRVRAAPFVETSKSQVAMRWEVLSTTATRRLPDAVLNILLPALERMTGAPARDAIRLLDRFFQEYRRCGHRDDAAQTVIETFEFSTLPGEVDPWWSVAKYGAFRRTSFDCIANVVHLVRDAAVLLILINVGMRPSELLRLMAGTKPRTLTNPREAGALGSRPTVPRCVTEVLSKTGFTILFLLNGHVFKCEDQPRPVSWLLGGRQDGGSDPAALHAVQVLEELHRPLRDVALASAKDLLLVDFSHERIVNDVETDHLTVDRLSASMKRNLAAIVDFGGLPDDEFGHDLRQYKAAGPSCIALYQCRKTYAQRLYGLDERLLGAISRQLQHASPDKTKVVYVTDDPSFRRELELGRSHYTSLLMLEELDGAHDGHGTISHAIDKIMGMAGLDLGKDIRTSLWDARQVKFDEANTDRFRPLAGLANLADKQAAVGEGQPARDPDGRGPAMLRWFISERREYLAALGSTEPDLGRPARDRAIHAARWLNERGFVVDGTVLPEEGVSHA